MTPRLWGRASSVNVQKVMWCLAELGVVHERIEAGGKFGQTDTPEFAAMNPNRRVPVWQENSLTLWESHAIIRHLVAAHPGAGIDHRSIADQWMEFTTTTLQPPLIGVFWQLVRTPVDQRSDKALAQHEAALDTALSVLEGQLAGPSWIAGDAISTGDIAAGSLMYRLHDLGYSRGAASPVTEWYERLTQRQCYRDTVMTSYEELRV